MTNHLNDIFIPAAPNTFVWIATTEWQGPEDARPPIYRVPVVGWRATYDRHHALPVVAGAELADDEPFLLESPDGPVIIGTMEAGWHSECPSMQVAMEAAGIPNS